MKYIFLLMAMTVTVTAQPLYQYEISRVIDGDTVEIVIPNLPKELKKIKLRIYGIDSPESGSLAKCDQEKKLGIKAKQYTKEIINNAADIGFTIKGWDKYGGRIIGDLIINGRNFGDLILQEQLARPYYGGKKQSWCAN